MMTDAYIPSVNDLRQLILAVDARLALLGATGDNPVTRDQLIERRRVLQETLSARGGGVQERLPYPEDS